jgi:UDP-N-acetylmuramoylalanine--D-glutamate ligase
MIQVKENINIFKNKNVLVIGLARSGTGAANLLSTLGARVTVTDKKPRASLDDSIGRLLPNINIITGANPVEAVDTSDAVVVSPGVPADTPLIINAKTKSIPVIGELELAYMVIHSCKEKYHRHDKEDSRKKRAGTTGTEFSTPALIGVTGTNGKSTVTTLIDLMLKKSGRRTLLGGNIGTALTEEVLKTGIVNPEVSCVSEPDTLPDFIVAEISSFQLETIKEFRPEIAAILNISPDHLDRYADLNDYIHAKFRIIDNQTPKDILVLNADDPVIMKTINARKEMIDKSTPRIAYFSAKKEVEGVYCKDNALFFNMPHFDSALSHLPIASVDEIGVKGVHNIENAMAASLVALIAGCSNHAVGDVLRNFQGLEHRLELVEEDGGVQYINDSKGTNVGAVARSLESFRNVILIMGGMDKDTDFSVLRELIKENVKLLILMGAAREKINNQLGGITDTRMVDSLAEAVGLSVLNASEGDTVLLSPGCASFDMFADFEERGRKFKEAVRNTLRGKSHES